MIHVPFALYSGSVATGQLIEFVLLTNRGAGTDLLQFDSQPGPQPAGLYTFRFNSIQQEVAGDERSPYTVNLVLARVPVPSALLLSAIGLLGVGVRWRVRP